MGMNNVRPYQANDLKSILSAWENASQLAQPFLSEEFMAQERHNIPNVYLPITDTWVVENNEGVIGFLALIGHEVGAIFVQPQFHGTGAGRALMNKARDLHDTLEVEVFEANVIGRNFYARYGFELLSESIHQETGNKLLRLRFIASDHVPE
jgi:putative acetyltransferase